MTNFNNMSFSFNPGFQRLVPLAGNMDKATAMQTSIDQLVMSLKTHRVNTLTELCRIERVAAACEGDNARAFQEPMTTAWIYYVHTNFLTELQGLSRAYPFSPSLVQEAKVLVTNDPDSNRSWNMAWLCLNKILDAGLVSTYAEIEAMRPAMWGGRDPTHLEVRQLASCFALEWNTAIKTMLRHWSIAPAWY